MAEGRDGRKALAKPRSMFAAGAARSAPEPRGLVSIERGIFLGRTRKTFMAINIKDPAAEQAVRELAALTGKSLTDAIRVAAEAMIEAKKAERAAEIERRRAAGLRIIDEISRLPVLDPRPWREIRDELWDDL
jgi:antitoxin VapB